MSSNVGLTTPRGSGTSGYVQKNHAFIRPRNAGYGAPYPPVSGDFGGKAFKQRQPDRQILEHDRRRAIEVKVMEERERLEEENERIEEEMEAAAKKGKGKAKKDKEEGEEDEDEGQKVLSEEEIDERCEVLRARLLKELEDEERGGGDRGRRPDARGLGTNEAKKLKRHQVHELAEAKIEESERLRKALGLKEDRETGEIMGREPFEGRRRD